MVKTKEFKSKETYKRFLAYEHIHGVEPRRGHYSRVEIAGRPHRVNHERR